MEEMIKECMAKKTENEEMVFAIGVGRIIPVIGKKKKMEDTLKYIKKMDGFVGVHPVDLWHNLLIFRTLNDAKRAKNDLSSKGVSMGQIAPVLVGKESL